VLFAGGVFMGSKRMVGCLRFRGGRRQANGLERGSSEGFVERVFELEADVFM